MQKNNIIIAIIIVCIILVGLVFYATNMNTDSDNATKDGNNSSINLMMMSIFVRAISFFSEINNSGLLFFGLLIFKP